MIKLSKTSKMPCQSWSIVPSVHCPRGSQLRKEKNSVCSTCYACKGRYTFNKVTAFRQAQFDYWKNSKKSDWVREMMDMILKSGTGLFRWFDSGDLVNKDMLMSIVAVCYNTPDVKHWLPTRETQLIRDTFKHSDWIPPNLNIRISADYIDSPASLGDLASWNGITTSEVHTGQTQAFTCNPEDCGLCRACWNRSVQTVSYKKH